MSQPVLGDSRYFEGTMPDSDQEDDCNREIIRAADLLSAPRDRQLKRAPSASPHLSQGSSQYWEGVSTPDENALCGIDDLDTTPLSKNARQTKWREGDNRNVTNNAYLKHPSGPGSVAMEVCTLLPASGNRTHCLGKRPLSELDDSLDAERASQRLKLDSTSSWSGRKGSGGLSSEDSGVFLPKQNVATDAQPPIVIAHSDHHQRYFGKLAWGVLWEIARLVSSQMLQYDDIPIDGLRDLVGPNAVAAPLVEQRLLPHKGDGRHRRTYEETFAKELNAKLPWAELDKEEESLKRNPLSGLGCNSVHDDWYGGKIAFTAKLRYREQALKWSNSMPQYYLELETPELGASTRFMRRWGSRRFLRVRIPDSIIHQSDNRLINYFKNDFVIHGRVFRPFYAKDHSVFLFELNCVYTLGRVLPDPRDSSVSFEQFIEWHNPMVLNKTQSLAKWCARMALGLSNSAPGVEIAPGEYIEIGDLYSPAGQAALDAGRKPESKDVMTDGAGYTNQSTLVFTKYKFNWDLVPSAIQFRLGGAKGLLLLHPDDNGASDEPFCVWIRSSQQKIKYESVERDRAHLVLDVLRRSQLKHPARLSTEIIVNLAQNGVSYHVFEGLMNDGLHDIVASLTQWSGPYAMQNLWAAVAGVNGSVIRSRMSREAAGSSRILGFGSRDKDDEGGEEEEAMELAYARSKAWWADETSGCPSTLEETIMVLLDAGFEPQSCAILAMKLKEVFKKALNSYIEKYKIVVPRSAEAWIVPDPCGVLEAGEIFLKTSESIVGQDGLSCDHLLGDVLVTRHPCCVPSDVQKVRAVWRDELRKYCDVIIFSVRGERSLASMLGGGDYDGDTVHVIWEPSIVNAFHNPDDKFADPPPGLDEAFERDTMTVDEFLAKREGHRDTDKGMIRDLQEYLLAALRAPSLVGQYSVWHDTAVYQFGYENDEAWRLAYMFCAVLDSSKTGKTVRPDVLKKDRRSYHGRRPAWKDSLLDESPSYLPPLNEPPRRQGKLSQIKFIMDHLKEEGRKKYHYHMENFEKFLHSARQQYKAQQGIMSAGLYVDSALEAPWEQAMKRAQRLLELDGNNRLMDELGNIRNHVQVVREKHRELMRHGETPRKERGGRSLSNSSFTSKPIERRQNILRELSLLFNQMPQEDDFLVLSPEDIRRCRASYAYVLETNNQEKRYANGFSRFPFDVAMRELGIIKAESIGSCKMVNSSFYSAFKVTGAIKAFRTADCPAYTYES